MGILCGRVKIELMSDLCVGSGYSYAGVVDADVSYDEYGIPFIPARRLKGCMREAAELVCPDEAEKLFGRSGDNGIKGMVLWNAYIEGYDSVAEELREAANAGCKESSYLLPQNILKMYTSIRAQTKICRNTGVAERNSLRYTRVVGQYNPLKEKIPLCLYAKVEFEDIYEEQLNRVMKAVRNIGLNRNRGLGSVRCSLTDVREIRNLEERPVSGEGGEGRICLSYVLRNREPLLMGSDNAEVSESYISGKSILGNLAGAYLRGKGRKAEDEAFKELFLDGSTIFTNVYLTIPPKAGREAAAQWPDYNPAPLYLNRLKKTRALVNRLGDNKSIPSERKAEYDTQNGNLPKKLKTHYVHEAEPNVFAIVEPEKEILYHNSRKELLYSLEAMKGGQYFKGKIYTNRKYAGVVQELLENTRLSFGKSRTAQYGNCELAADITVENVGKKTISAESGERIAAVMESDAIFLNEESGYTVRFEEVKELIGKQLGIPYEQLKDEGSILQMGEATGYNTTWNLRRPGIPVVKVGSVLVYTIKSGHSWRQSRQPDQLFVGERNLEGYGQAQIIKCCDMAYAPETLEKQSNMQEEKLSFNSCKPFLVRILTEQLLERLIFLYTTGYSRLNLTASTVGRLNLMLQESLNEHRSNPEQAFWDFCTRIDSIKRTKEKEEAFRLLSVIMMKDRKKEEAGKFELDIRKMTEDKNDSKLEEIKNLLKLYTTDEEYRKKIMSIWGKYMGNILTYHKYLKKQEGGSKENAQ